MNKNQMKSLVIASGAAASERQAGIVEGAF